MSGQEREALPMPDVPNTRGGPGTYSRKMVAELVQAARAAQGEAEVIGWARPEDLVDDGYGHTFSVHSSEPGTGAYVPLCIAPQPAALSCGWVGCPHGAECVHARAAAPVVPQGWPTAEMIQAGVMARRSGGAMEDVLRAALAAAPKDGRQR